MENIGELSLSNINLKKRTKNNIDELYKTIIKLFKL